MLDFKKFKRLSKKESAIRSGAFSLSNKTLQLFITIASLAILGRLLTPEDFGLFAIVLATQAIFTPVLDLGLTPAFIKLEHVDQGAYNTFFTLNFAFGLLNTSFLIVVAPFLSFYYHNPVLLPLTMVFASSILLRALSQQRLASLTREKRFDKLMGVNIGSILIGTVVAVACAFMGFGVWALVIKAIISSLFINIGARFAFRYHYRLVGLTTIRQYASSIRLGAEIVISRLFAGALLYLDKLIFAKFFSIADLGQYTKAIQLTYMPDSNIRMALSTPALAHISRQDKEKNIESYRIFCNVIILVAGFPCVLLILLGDWILPWLMGPQWIQGGQYAQILGVWGIGEIMYGMGILLYTNELQTRKWMFITGIATLLVISAALAGVWFGGKPLHFVVGLSLSNFFFWIIAFGWSLFRISGSKALPFNVSRTLFSMLFVAGVTGIPLRQALSIYLPNVGSTINIILISFVTSLAVILGQYLFNKGQATEVALFIKRRIS